jgi:hypothetical protein
LKESKKRKAGEMDVGESPRPAKKKRVETSEPTPVDGDKEEDSSGEDFEALGDGSEEDDYSESGDEGSAEESSLEESNEEKNRIAKCIFR